MMLAFPSRKVVRGLIHWREVLSRMGVPQDILAFSEGHRSLRALWFACPKEAWLSTLVACLLRSWGTHDLSLADREADAHLERRSKLYGRRRADRYRRIVPWRLVSQAFKSDRKAQAERYAERRIRADVKCQSGCRRRRCEDCREHRDRVEALVLFYQQRDEGRGIYGRMRVYVRHAVEAWREEQKR